MRAPDTDEITPWRDDAASPDPVRGYLRAIARHRVLPPDEQRALFDRLARERAVFLDAALALPETGAALVRRWQERRQAGLVTAVLSARHREGGGADVSGEVDTALSEVARLLGRARRARERRRKASVGGRVAARLREADLAFDVVLAAFREATDDAAAATDAAPRFSAAHAALAAFESTRRAGVEHNLRLVLRFARHYSRMGVDLADLIQEGNLGLMRAVEKFDPGRGLMFSTYAAWWLQQSMIRAVQKQSRTVRPPSNVFEDVVRFRRAEAALRARNACEPSVEEIAEAAGLSEGASDHVVAAMTPVVSTHAPVAGLDGPTLDETLANDVVSEPGGELDREVLRAALPPLLSRLPFRERIVLEARFGLVDEQPVSLAEVGARLKLSRERIRQIEASALGRLRKRPELARLAVSFDATGRAQRRCPEARATG